MKLKTLLAPLSLVCIICVDTICAGSELYYWKDYTGDIPPDAFAAGKSSDGKNVYIGQAYRPNKGILPVQINSGHKEVYTFTEKKVERTEMGVKILCGNSSIFEWLPTNKQKFNTDARNKNLVVGGFQTLNYFIGLNHYIGRSLYLGEIKVGTIDPSSANFYFHHNGQELDLAKYEVLSAKKYEQVQETESSTETPLDFDIDVRVDGAI